MPNSHLIFEEETAQLRKGLFYVQNEVGLGHREEVYHHAMMLWMERQGIPFVSKSPETLLFGGELAYTLYPDLVVWDKITVELKSVVRHLREPEYVQLFNYLKKKNHRLGLLVNMGLDRVYVKRVVYEQPAFEWCEDWAAWRDCVEEDIRELGSEVRDVLHRLYTEHQTGYGAEVVEALLRFAFQLHGLPFEVRPVAFGVYGGEKLGKTPLDCWLIEGRILFVFTALFDDNQFNISRGLSFMRNLGVAWGLAVNFGKKNVQISGLSSPIRGGS